MRVKCYSVSLKSFTPISNKCYKAIDWQGNEALIPASQYLANDSDRTKSDCYWISEWILSKKNINYSRKKCAWIDSETMQVHPNIEVVHHVPKEMKPIKRSLDEFTR